MDRQHLINRMVLIVCVFGLGVALCQSAGASSMKIGYFVLEPHIFPSGPDGKAKGALVDFFKQKIATESGVAIKWIGPLPPTRILHYLKTGELDGVCLLLKSMKRERFLFYADKVIYRAPPVLVFLEGHPLDEIQSMDDIIDLKIGYALGIQPSSFMRSARLKEFDKAPGTDWIKNSLMKLNRGRIDAVHSPDPATILYNSKQMNLRDRIKVLTLPEPPIEFYMAFSKSSSRGRALLEQYNRLAEKMEDVDAVYTEYLRKYTE